MEQKENQKLLSEILQNLEMPPGALRKWFKDIEKFCLNHGGSKHYSELLELAHRCLAQLDSQQISRCNLNMKKEVFTQEEFVLIEAFENLQMPKSGLKKWFQHDKDFCNGHGGQRVYPELLNLLDRCEAAFQKMEDLEHEA